MVRYAYRRLSRAVGKAERNFVILGLDNGRYSTIPVPHAFL